MTQDASFFPIYCVGNQLVDSDEQLADSEQHLVHLGLDLVYGGDSAVLVLLEDIRAGQDIVGYLVAG